MYIYMYIYMHVYIYGVTKTHMMAYPCSSLFSNKTYSKLLICTKRPERFAFQRASTTHFISYTYACIHVNIYMYPYIYVHIYAYICIYTHTLIYIYVYIYVYIYACICNWFRQRAKCAHHLWARYQNASTMRNTE